MDLLGAYVGILPYTFMTRLTSFSGVSSKTFFIFIIWLFSWKELIIANFEGRKSQLRAAQYW